MIIVTYYDILICAFWGRENEEGLLTVSMTGDVIAKENFNGCVSAQFVSPCSDPGYSYKELK